MNSPRAYDMTARSAAAARTAERIVLTTMEFLETVPTAEITLKDVAAGSSVTVQTVLRRFGDRDSLLSAAIERFAREVFAHRGQATSADVEDAVTNLVDHYERWGRLVMKLITEQSCSPVLQATVQGGAEYHREWCARVFATALSDLTGAARARRIAQLVAVCDVRTWDLLRQQGGLSRAQTRTALLEMLEPLTMPTT
ncbi:TetR/AcrR family transcriptional regulator [Mycolicibacterium hodleri]|uniref:TetR/AcrR family transcriptional regulator n=1 Tax=Mycolicibacterium hodleri TaxID=49897 RepID=A0A502DM24_9MYCO|nr:TetR/AcrR family transcriptional regulator [Mycolicibacterium hodleri]TPG25221.1 TetR/AcrR family transcriptional regulator [Mycolicibacterium hodleri]